MKLMTKLVVATGLLGTIPSFADTILLDFEGQPSFGSLTYNQVLHANPALQGLVNDGGGTGTNGEYFSNNTSGTTVMFAGAPADGERAELVANAGFGFTDLLSFHYSSSTGGTVYVRDDAGAVLAQTTLSANSTSLSSPFSIWTFVELTFAGVAHSIDFSDALFTTAFDDVQVNAVPLPAAVALLPFGLAAFGLVRRRKKPVGPEAAAVS
jgi:hypothetical protein